MPSTRLTVGLRCTVLRIPHSFRRIMISLRAPVMHAWDPIGLMLPRRKLTANRSRTLSSMVITTRNSHLLNLWSHSPFSRVRQRWNLTSNSRQVLPKRALIHCVTKSVIRQRFANTISPWKGSYHAPRAFHSLKESMFCLNSNAGAEKLEAWRDHLLPRRRPNGETRNKQPTANEGRN